MCGIIGIATTREKDLIPDIISSLSDLEYRGYDSAGIAFFDGGKIKVYKCIGAPSQNLHASLIRQKFNLKKIATSVAIGHNRWATHGEPSIQNAHPHIDCGGDIAVAHNGTILNYAGLKKELEEAGHIFLSETDTEIIPHLIEHYLRDKNTIEESVVKTTRRLEGSFGLVVAHSDKPKTLYVSKNGSPLVIGVTKDSIIAASSANALIRYTDTIVPLSDGEIAVLSAVDTPTYRISRFDDKENGEITRSGEKIIGISREDVSKGDFETFMLKEIFEQPASVKATLLGRYDIKSGDAILGGLTDFNEFLTDISNICFVSCGTAYNAASVGKEIIESLTEIQAETQIASEFRYRKHNFPKTKTAVIAVSQSGETADTLEAVKEAGRKGYKTFGIVNVVGSAIAEATDGGVYTRAGAEIGVASTKAFTAQLAVLYLFALKLARERGMQTERGKEYLSELKNMPDILKKALNTLPKEMKTLADIYKNVLTINFLGRGIHVSVANEAALKFKELTYLEAGSYPLGELKHGPIAIIDKNSLSVVIAPKDELFQISKNSIEQIKSKGGRVVLITSEDAKGDSGIEKADHVVYLPALKEKLFYPLLEVLPLQLFVYHFARNLGRNIDKPRNLAKAVTVE
ncbi:MAG: glutamine--fructose-6-phosphate transaminase (isomerizing) [Patescibacteria group bacterium]